MSVLRAAAMSILINFELTSRQVTVIAKNATATAKGRNRNQHVVGRGGSNSISPLAPQALTMLSVSQELLVDNDNA